MDEINETLTEVQELVWALIDDVATETQVKRLEQLILDDEDARLTYVMCMQMHADLHFLFNKRPAMPAVVEKAIQAEKARKTVKPNKTALPVVDLPTSFPSATMVDGCM